MEPRQTYYPGLDVVRFCAAMLVALYHLAWRPWAGDYHGALLLLPAMPSPDAPAFGAPFGWVGVQIFFVLSGIVIANSATNSSPGHFIRHRILRLYPVAIIAALIAAAIFLAEGKTGIALPFLRSLVLWPTGPWLSGVYWTLPVEMAFYALVSCWLAFLPGRPLAWLAAGLIGWSAVFYALDRAHWGPHSDTLSALLLFRYGLFFAIGMLLFSLKHDRGGRWRVALLAIALGLAIHAILVFPGEASRGSAALVFAAAIAAMGGTLFLPQAGESLAWARRTGLMTYPLYLLHFVIGTAVELHLFRLGAGANVAAAAGITAAVASSYLIVGWPEKALRRKMKTLLERGAAS